jgi:long-chain acyl-CoA synthetase
MYAAMLGATPGHDLYFGSLRVCISAGAALPVEVLRRFEGKFDCTVLEGYGLPETSWPASFNHPVALRKLGSIGTLVDGVRMRVVDEHAAEVPTGTPKVAGALRCLSMNHRPAAGNCASAT